MAWDYSRGEPVWTGSLPMTVPTLTDAGRVAGGRIVDVSEGGYALLTDGTIAVPAHRAGVTPPAGHDFVAVASGPAGKFGYALRANGQVVGFGTLPPALPAGTYVQIAASDAGAWALEASTGYGKSTSGVPAFPQNAFGVLKQITQGCGVAYGLHANGAILSTGAHPLAVGIGTVPADAVHLSATPCTDLTIFAKTYHQGGHVLAWRKDGTVVVVKAAPWDPPPYMTLGNTTPITTAKGDMRTLAWGYVRRASTGAIQQWWNDDRTGGHGAPEVVEPHVVHISGGGFVLDDGHVRGGSNLFRPHLDKASYTTDAGRSVSVLVQEPAGAVARTTTSADYVISWGDGKTTDVPKGTPYATAHAHVYAVAPHNAEITIRYPAVVHAADPVLYTSGVNPSAGSASRIHAWKDAYDWQMFPAPAAPVLMPAKFQIGISKVWNGTAFVSVKGVGVWNGTAWV